MGSEAKMNNEVILSVEKLYFSYKDADILRDINFNLNKGELCSIIGPNGAGKTTFLNVLSGRLVPKRGNIIYKSMNVSRLSAHKKRNLGISRSFQILNLFEEKTVFENVRYAVQAINKRKYSLWKNIDDQYEITEQVLQLLDTCHLLDKRDLICKDMAYAEKRLVEIALSLAGNPEILLLDEPTAGLSVEESRYMADFIKSLSQDMEISIVFIEHDMDIVFEISDSIAVLYYGELLVNDKPESVKSNKKVQEVYLGDVLNG